MSLLITASPWINENVDSSAPRKRQSTMKYQKKQPEIMNNDIQSYEDNEINNHSEGLQNMEPTTIEKSQTINNDRTDRINNLINQMTAISPDNDGNKLANFNPPPPPTIINKNNNVLVPNDLLPQKQINQNNVMLSNVKNTYTANDSNLGIYSNYKNSYEPTNIQLKPYYAKMGISNTGNVDDKIMEKINYMIHMLEEQQNEKTNSVTEEFILYTFLGVFIIFVVDSFARAGKYIR